MITGINESKTLTKHICECECKFDSRKCNSNQKWNEGMCRWECKSPRKHQLCKKDYIWNPSTRTCKNRKYLGSITGDSVFTCDKIIDATKTTSTNFNEKKYHNSVDSCQYLLLFHEIPIKRKTFITILRHQ